MNSPCFRLGFRLASLTLAIVVAMRCSGLVVASVMADIGHTRLADELGSSLPDGSGISVSQVEAAQPESLGGGFAPNPADSQFVGKVFNIKSPVVESFSNHARGVGRVFFGNTLGVAPGVSTIDVWNADHWSSNHQNGSSFLKTGSTLEPAVEVRDIQNHSWIGSFDSTANNVEALRRFDFTINRDDFVAVVGVNNGVSDVLPNLLAHSNNAIAVGRSDGKHSAGLTTIDGLGRIKPDIVAPRDTVSGAVPTVGGVAAMLLQAGAGTAAMHSETIKALLLAGATKHEQEFGGTWDRTPTRPLDEVFGAGEVNVYRSFQILTAGQQSSSTTLSVGHTGWDYVTNSSSDEQLYFFNVFDDAPVQEFSAVLTWNRVITDGRAGSAWGNPQAFLADLRLELWDASDFTLGTMLDYSDSANDNVEHIYQQQLQPGQYALKVTGAAGTDFALAWLGTDYGLLGDINLDGVVSGDGTGPWETDDVTAFLEGWRWSQASPDITSWKKGDLNQDGVTDLRDFALLRDSLASATGASLVFEELMGSGVASLSVPEPSSLLLAVLLVAAGTWLSTRMRTARAA